MLQNLHIEDETTLRIAARRLYREKGMMVVMQAAYEMMLGAQIFFDVILEERNGSK